jgi:glycosyltransferase involved in cell wall biosynthesis
MTRLAERLVDDASVTVLCGPTAYDLESVAVDTPVDPRVAVSRVEVGQWNKNRLASRLMRSMLLTIGLALRLLIRARRGDTVVLVTNPPLLLLSIAVISSFRRLQLVVIVHDVYPEVLTVARLLSPTGIMFRVLRRTFNCAYSAADRLVVIGRDMHELFVAKVLSSGGRGRIAVIENWADTERVIPLTRETENVVRLQFAGNLGRVQGLLPLLAAVREAANNEIAIDLIGTGALRDALIAFSEEHGLTQVQILPPFARPEQRRTLSECDIGIVSLEAGMFGLGVPSKAYNILAAGRAILFIGDPRSEIGRMVSEYAVGWVVQDHGSALVEFLRGLSLSMRPDILARGVRARDLAVSRFSEARQLEAYASVILG